MIELKGQLTETRCEWWVEVPSNNPEPDSPADCWKTVECGAKAHYDVDGRFACEAGHERGTLEEELGPNGYEWQREMGDRMND